MSLSISEKNKLLAELSDAVTNFVDVYESALDKATEADDDDFYVELGEAVMELLEMHGLG